MEDFEDAWRGGGSFRNMMYVQICAKDELESLNPKLFSLLQQHKIMFDDYWFYWLPNKKDSKWIRRTPLKINQKWVLTEKPKDPFQKKLII